ncbi:MAG: DNA-processing protein DprA [Peptostreptococcaceae bacterium]
MLSLNEAYLLLISIPNVCSSDIYKLEKFIDLRHILDIKNEYILNIKNINTNIKENIVQYKSKSYLGEVKENLIKNKVSYVSINDDLYPKNLKNIYEPPKILFFRGDISILNNGLNITMVGARKCSTYGKYCAENFSRELSKVGVNILSGLAMGIDSYSHEACIGNKGKTVAVIASSVDNITPKISICLGEKILNDGGCILSEYYIGSNVYPHNFVKRNRILSGISDGVLVVEASQKSGSLITVDFALEQGKNIFCIPGNINSITSQGCNNIIKEGAKLTTNLDDILQEYNHIKFEFEEKKKFDKIKLNDYSQKIINIIKQKGVSNIDEICETTKLSIKIVNSNINELILNDLIIEMDNKNYSLNI